jgi:tetratricopeptide (TPR) repeat protein
VTVGSARDRVTRDDALRLLARVEAAEPELKGAQPVHQLDRLEREHDKLIEALDWFEEQGEYEQALRMSSVLWRVWWDRGYIAEGRVRLERLLTATEGDPAGALRARALSGAGVLAFRQSDNDQARAHQLESLVLARRVGDRETEANALGGLARVGLRDHDFVAARERAQDSIAIWRELGDEYGLSRTLHVLAYVEYMEDDDERARTLFEESIELNRRLGALEMVAGELTNLGSVETRTGNIERAQELCEESLRLADELGSAYLLPYCIVNLGGVASAKGAYERAARLLGAGKGLFDSTGAAMDPGTAIEFERHLERTRGSLDEARFSSAWDEGRLLTAAQATEYALAAGA